MRSDAADFGEAVNPAGEPPAPLFEHVDGPFSRSKFTPNKVELMIACLIWRHKGHAHPISISKIIQLSGIKLDERQVKKTVGSLVCEHRCRIGASTGDPSGYFWIVTAEDERIGTAHYRAQWLDMGRRLRVLLSDDAYSELVGQQRLPEA
jgi:hypothetical protein